MIFAGLTDSRLLWGQPLWAVLYMRAPEQLAARNTYFQARWQLIGRMWPVYRSRSSDLPGFARVFPAFQCGRVRSRAG
jgi:hypothetical protein